MPRSSHDPAHRLHNLSNALKRLGYATQRRIKLYGQELRLVGDPIVMTDSVVFIDAIEAKTGSSMRVRIPLNVVNMAQAQVAA
jgi:hypothetical protein